MHGAIIRGDFAHITIHKYLFPLISSLFTHSHFSHSLTLLPCYDFLDFVLLVKKQS